METFCLAYGNIALGTQSYNANKSIKIILQSIKEKTPKDSTECRLLIPTDKRLVKYYPPIITKDIREVLVLALAPAFMEGVRRLAVENKLTEGAALAIQVSRHLLIFQEAVRLAMKMLVRAMLCMWA